jgi:hypothetical protein
MASLFESQALVRLARFLAVVVVCGGVALRFFRLDADTDYYAWAGYILDEGRWVAHARAMALFGNAASVGWSLHLLMAPLFQLVCYAVFLVFDVSLLTSRLFSAVSGSMLLVIFWLALRRTASPEALLLVLTMLAVETDLVVLSRLAIPEMAAMLLELVAYVLLVAGRRSLLRIALAGALTAGAIGMKATVLPVAFIFALILLSRSANDGDPSRRASVASFAAGALAPFVATAPALAAGWLPVAGPSLADTLRILRGFVGPTSFFELISLPFSSDIASVLPIWALGAWIGLLGRLAAGSDRADTASHPYLTGAIVWVGLYTPLMFLLHYFPLRYQFHVLLPLAVIIAAGITMLQRGGIAELDARLADFRGARRLGAVLLVILPGATLAAPTVAAAAAALGLDPTRVRVRYTCLVLVVIAVWGPAVDRVRRGQTVGFFVLFPVLWAYGWLVAQRAIASPPLFWPTGEPGEGIARWLLLLFSAASVALVFARGWHRARHATAIGILLATAAYAALGLMRLAPGYLHPHYSIRTVSRDLGVLLAGTTGEIRVANGESLFNENRLAYQSILGRNWSATRPEVVVVAVINFDFKDPQAILEHEYRLIRTYSVWVSPAYVRARSLPRMIQTSPPSGRVHVYRRLGPAD